MLRPPTIMIALSATMTLLWERRLTRDGSVKRSAPAAAAAAEGVEGTDLDVGMRRQPRDRGIATDDAVVVQQHAHAHAAVGGPDDAVGEQVPADVGVPDVVLQIERPFREVGQGESRLQRHGPVAEGLDTRLLGMLGRRRLEETAQRRRGVIPKRGRRKPRILRVVGRATGRDREREQHPEPASEPWRRTEEGHDAVAAAGRQADPQSKRLSRGSGRRRRGASSGGLQRPRSEAPLRRRVWYAEFEGSSSPFVRGFDHPLTDEQPWEKS